MEQKINAVEISEKELRDMKAVEEQMKLTVQSLSDQLEEVQGELSTTKESLKVTSKDLRATKLLLHSAVELQVKAEDTAAACEDVMTGFLMRWLSVENQKSVKNILRFYHPLERVRMMSAVLTYLMFGKRQHLMREVEAWHFKLICEKLDEDAITLPAHSLMVRLMQKYGLFDRITE